MVFREITHQPLHNILVSFEVYKWFKKQVMGQELEGGGGG